MPSELKAHDLITMLRRHYLPEGKPPAGIFAPEIQAPGSSRRADLIWQGCTSAGGRELVGHEVKVSRADVLAELADLAKSDPWQQYCERWWLVIPDLSLIEGLALPPSWGVLVPPSGRRTRTMTVVVPAPKLNPVEQGPAFRTIATWLHWKHDAALRDAEQQRTYVRQLQDTNRELYNQLPRDAVEKREDLKVIEQIVVALGGAHHTDGLIGDWDKTVSVDDVVATLLDLAAAKHRRVEAERSLSLSINRLRGLHGTVSRALQEFDPEGKEASRG